MDGTSLVDRAGQGGLRFARRHRRLVASVVFGVVAAGSLTLAYLARFEFESAAFAGWGFGQALALLVCIRLCVNHVFRLGISRWRFAGTHDFLRLLGATTVGSALFFAGTMGTIEGMITFNTNDPEENPFNFRVTGAIAVPNNAQSWTLYE